MLFSRIMAFHINHLLFIYFFIIMNNRLPSLKLGFPLFHKSLNCLFIFMIFCITNHIFCTAFVIKLGLRSFLKDLCVPRLISSMAGNRNLLLWSVLFALLFHGVPSVFIYLIKRRNTPFPTERTILPTSSWYCQ